MVRNERQMVISVCRPVSDLCLTTALVYEALCLELKVFVSDEVKCLIKLDSPGSQRPTAADS